MERRPAVRALVYVCAWGVAVAALSGARGSADDLRLGVLPFVDATGTGGTQAGPTLSRLVQAEIVHSTNLVSRVLTPTTRVEELDVEKAAQVGKDASVDVVLMATVLDASSEQSSKGGWTPSVLGRSVGGNVRRVTAKVVLQGDLIDVGTAKRVASFRVTGEDSDTRVGATVWTGLGAISSDSNAWLESPVGKATQKAVVELVKRINSEMTH